MTKEQHTFEEAISRLEDIINTVNSGKSSLDDSLKLYEEADSLMDFCEKKISIVEKRMTTLMQKHEIVEKNDKEPLIDSDF